VTFSIKGHPWHYVAFANAIPMGVQQQCDKKLFICLYILQFYNKNKYYIKQNVLSLSIPILCFTTLTISWLHAIAPILIARHVMKSLFHIATSTLWNPSFTTLPCFSPLPTVTPASYHSTFLTQANTNHTFVSPLTPNFTHLNSTFLFHIPPPNQPTQFIPPS